MNLVPKPRLQIHLLPISYMKSCETTAVNFIGPNEFCPNTIDSGDFPDKNKKTLIFLIWLLIAILLLKSLGNTWKFHCRKRRRLWFLFWSDFCYLSILSEKSRKNITINTWRFPRKNKKTLQSMPSKRIWH